MSSNPEAITKAADNGDVAKVRRLISLKCSPDTCDSLFVCYMENACIIYVEATPTTTTALFCRNKNITPTCRKVLALYLKSRIINGLSANPRYWLFLLLWVFQREGLPKHLLYAQEEVITTLYVCVTHFWSWRLNCHRYIHRYVWSSWCQKGCIT